MKSITRTCISLLILTALTACLLITPACGGGSDSSQKPFDGLYKQYQKLLAYSSPDYPGYLKHIDQLQINSRAFLKKFSQSKQRPEAERILNEITGTRLKVQQEHMEFSQLEKQLTAVPPGPPTSYQIEVKINDVKNFLRKYPGCIKKNLLAQELEKLLVQKFQAQTAAAPATIPDVNKAVQLAVMVHGQLSAPSLKARVNSEMKRLEGLRQNVYDHQFHLNAAQLLKQMREKAMEMAKESHSFSKIESVKENVISGDLSVPTGQVTVTREYIVSMRGAIVGLNRYRVTLQAGGMISGTLQTGVSFTFTGITKTGDIHIK